ACRRGCPRERARSCGWRPCAPAWADAALVPDRPAGWSGRQRMLGCPLSSTASGVGVRNAAVLLVHPLAALVAMGRMHASIANTAGASLPQDSLQSPGSTLGVERAFRFVHAGIGCSPAASRGVVRAACTGPKQARPGGLTAR